MNILVLTRYGNLGASSRLRTLQYNLSFEAAGINMTALPLFSNNYVLDLQRNSRNYQNVITAYFSRIKTLLLTKTRSFDLIWIEKEALPWIPFSIEMALLFSRQIPYVLDYDDAVFHFYTDHSNSMVRRILGRKHPLLIRGAALIIAGNDYLADYAYRAGALNVQVIPTVIDLEHYPKPISSRLKPNSSLLNIGWIGQRSTARYLFPYKNIFERLIESGKAYFSAIGIDTSSLGLPMTSIPWSEQTEVASLSSFDIGIMPLDDKPFERGKCGYKIIQYMACGLPVVASPVGVNCKIVEHGINGFLAETPKQWEESLQILLADAGLRQRMGMAGRLKIEKEYSLQEKSPKLIELLIKTSGEAKLR